MLTPLDEPSSLPRPSRSSFTCCPPGSVPAAVVSFGLLLLCREMRWPEPLALAGLLLALPWQLPMPLGLLRLVLPVAAVAGVVLTVFG